MYQAEIDALATEVLQGAQAHAVQAEVSDLGDRVDGDVVGFDDEAAVRAGWPRAAAAVGVANREEFFDVYGVECRRVSECRSTYIYIYIYMAVRG